MKQYPRRLLVSDWVSQQGRSVHWVVSMISLLRLANSSSKVTNSSPRFTIRSLSPGLTKMLVTKDSKFPQFTVSFLVVVLYCNSSSVSQISLKTLTYLLAPEQRRLINDSLWISNNPSNSPHLLLLSWGLIPKMNALFITLMLHLFSWLTLDDYSSCNLICIWIWFR